ncbi:MAG TPA: DUF192 domain-containing protein [Rectinemataceae bacterium]|nr:DUF192 domain-containing protein [Rectinemataceae bacterium]
MIMVKKTRPWLGRLALACLAASLFALASCAAKGAEAEPTRPNPKLKTVELKIGDASVQAELARTSLERETGLMFRTSLAEGTGMLFVFEADQQLAFWMKNTKLPLSLAYISSDGTIREIFDLVPGSLDPVQSERSVRYALEVPRGWFAKAGIKSGDRVAIPPLD